MSGRFAKVVDPVIGEEVWTATTGGGLAVRVTPTPRFRESCAVLSVRYGSTDLGFFDGDQQVRTPLGMAHYLEHKLFEDEELQAFDRFAVRGAQVNAMTGFARTQYFFTATDRFRENLEDLLRLVTTAHITDENVEKEREIIAQEVRMYEDSPQFCTMFDLLGCLYAEHPVRYAVGGTVESIQDITAAGLLQCHRVFYTGANAALAVSGPVEPDEVLDVAEAWPLPAGPAPERVVVAEDGPVEQAHTRRSMPVARPKVLIGFKDRSSCAGPEERLDRQLATRVYLDRLFAASSEVREDLHRRGIVDDSLSTGYHEDRSFGFGVVGCETDKPDRVVSALEDVLLQPVELDEEHLERLRRRALGQFVRSLDSVKSLAFGHGQEALEGLPPFFSVQRMGEITMDMVRARGAELFRRENLAVAVTEVGDGGS